VSVVHRKVIPAIGQREAEIAVRASVDYLAEGNASSDENRCAAHRMTVRSANCSGDETSGQLCPQDAGNATYHRQQKHKKVYSDPAIAIDGVQRSG
jgi:hypothetical protein